MGKYLTTHRTVTECMKSIPTSEDIVAVERMLRELEAKGLEVVNELDFMC